MLHKFDVRTLCCAEVPLENLLEDENLVGLEAGVEGEDVLDHGELDLSSEPKPKKKGKAKAASKKGQSSGQASSSMEVCTPTLLFASMPETSCTFATSTPHSEDHHRCPGDLPQTNAYISETSVRSVCSLCITKPWSRRRPARATASCTLSSEAAWKA